MAAELKPFITIDDLDKIDIRCGTILSAEDLENSKTLVKLTVDLGEEEPRTILCGMKGEREDVHEIEGKQALFVANMAPRKICGIMSQGMVFDIGYADGLKKPALSCPEHPVPNGSRAG